MGMQQLGAMARRVAWLAIVWAMGSCSLEVLVAGAGAPPDGGGPAPATGGAPDGGAAVAPLCDGPLFASAGLPGISMPDRATDAVTGDWNGDGFLDLAAVDPNLSAISVVLGRGDGTFASRAEYSTGAGPVKIATADLNGDGHPDLVVASSGAASATVWLGKGDGTFGRRLDLPTGPRPQVVAIADFTADGKPDLIAGDTLFVGKGDGSFAHGVTYGYQPGSLAQGDLNGDGKVDLVVTQSTTSSVLVLLSRSDGTFTAKPIPSLGGYAVADLVLRDLNRDNRLDLVLSESCLGEGTSHLLTLLGTGDGTFGSERLYDTVDIDPVCGLPLMAADVDGDGTVDLQFGAAETWPGQGDGTFRAHVISSVAVAGTVVSLADWNRDGRPDLAALDDSPVLQVLPGHGDGTFGRLPIYPFDSQLSQTVRVADATGDGQPDLVGVDYVPAFASSAVILRRGNGDGTFAARLEYPLGARIARSVTVGDANGDGWPDLVTIDEGQAVSVALGDGQGGFPYVGAYPTPGWAMDVAVGEVDGDGRPDVLVVDADLRVDAFLGTGHGFAPPVVTDTALAQGTTMKIGDLDGDGRLDVLAMTNSTPPFARLYFGSSSGTLNESNDLELDDALQEPLLADWDADGKPDLIAGNSNGQAVRIWPGLGSGVFGAPIDEPIPSATSSSGPAAVIAAADFNGDGALDVVLLKETTRILLGRGDGTFACASPAVRDLVPYDPYGGIVPSTLFPADLNHDGRADLVNSFGRAATVLISR